MPFSSGAPKFRVAICGAGIGGLVLAITIGQFAGRDVEVDIYEAHDTITTAGVGIFVSRRTIEVIETLCLHEEFSRASTKPSSSTRGLSKSLSVNRVLINTSRIKIQEV
ncbi:hypothetical protein AZE42_06104 [Rhizopogon vesiculosus]|uniref:FAD-binding domain-containing protein n=1 Tax=Rhizopogon vesiculosus TaxID=180088 RepID=A0A1J8PGL1_9AGAM|nr:hypothetical protein AZE42_06104 [Rhizopogon vesiculosus]